MSRPFWKCGVWASRLALLFSLNWALTQLQSLTASQSMLNIENMASITIRNLDERTKQLLRLRAARLNSSMEEEARTILKAALATEESTTDDLASRIRARFGPLGGVELELPPRESLRDPPILC